MPATTAGLGSTENESNESHRPAQAVTAGELHIKSLFNHHITLNMDLSAALMAAYFESRISAGDCQHDARWIT